MVQKLWSAMYCCKMVTNVMCAHVPHVQAAQDIFLVCLKTLTQATILLRFGNVLTSTHS